MPYIPVVATRFASSYSITAGAATEVTSTIAWPNITVDYGNEGATTEPPTRSYTGVINITGEGDVCILLPLSNESIFQQPPLSGEDFDCSVKWIIRLRRF